MARGITAVQLESQPIENAEQSMSKYPCYIGQAPIWQVDSQNWKDIAGKTLIIKNIEQMRKEVGFYKPETGAWSKEFSLCAAGDYHFAVKRVGPIILLINKAAITEKEEKTQEVFFGEGEAIIKNPYIVINTLKIEGKTKGEDYTAGYDKNGRNIIITALKDMKTAEVKYKEVDTTTLLFSEDTFEEMDFFEQTVGAVPDVVCAPIWENEKITADATVGEKLMLRAQEQLNNHWYVQSIAQLSGETKTEAEENKKSYASHKVKTCWPCVKKDGVIYPLAIVYVAAKEKVDAENNGVPFESASNEDINIDGLCTETGGEIRIKEVEANALNAAGIATANFSNMKWVTWGVCMSNYSEAEKEDIQPDKLNDVAVQMKDFVSNAFQERYAMLIDKPMQTRQTRDIVTDFQRFLDVLVNAGQLIFGNVKFLESNNSASNLADGTFTFSIAETNTPPGKAIIGEVAYSADELENSFGGGE